MTRIKSRINWVLLACIAVILVAGLVLVGWALDIKFLKSVVPGFIEMKANTAIGFQLLALVILLQQKENSGRTQSTVASLFTLVCFLIGGFTLAEYLFGRDYGIDELIFKDSLGASGRFPPGRLAPITAILFMLVSTSLHQLYRRKHAAYRSAQFLLLLSMVIAFQALMGYLFGVHYSFGKAYYTQMAVHTTLLFIVVCGAALFSRRNLGWINVLTLNSLAGRLGRNLMAAAIIVPPVVNWVQSLGTNAGLYDADFGLVLSILGNTIFFIFVIIRNTAILHETDLKRIEVETNYRSMAELSPLIFWTANPDGFLDYYNPRWFEYTGMTLEQTQGWGWKPVIHPDDLPLCLERWTESVKTGKPYDIEYRFKRASDGQYRWFLGRALPARDASGKIIKWFGSGTDIDDQKKGEEERAQAIGKQQAAASIERSEARLRAIFDAAFDAIVGMDSDGMVSEWNPQAEKIFGWKASEAIGKRMSELIVPHQYRDAHEQGMRHFLKSGHGPVLNTTIEIEALRKNGELFPIELSITPVKLGGVYTFTAFISDITIRKRSERELIAAKESALDAAQAKSLFLANMSHEIRTPLNGIIGMTDLVLETTLTEQQRRYLKIVQDSGNGLLTIINDILDFSKIEAGKLALEIVDFDASSLVELQAELLVGRALQKGLALMTYVDPAVPRILKGDPGRLAQILLNLLSNAIKFTEKGEVLVSAELLDRQNGLCRVRFSVKDSGIGLSEDVAAKLFQPFTQADGTTARKYGGTGLGLSISKRLVELMGGNIGISSRLGEGATFWFELSFVEKDALKPEAHEELGELSGKKILVMDENPTSCEIYRKYFASWQMRVDTVPTCSEAFARLKAEAAKGYRYDLAILDKHMPEGGTSALAKQILEDPELKGTHLLLATAFDRSLQGLLPASDGFASILRKPIRQSELYDAIADVMSIKVGELSGRSEPAGPKSGASGIVQTEKSNQRILVVEDNAVNQLLAMTLLKKMGYSAHAVGNGKEALAALSEAKYDLVLMDCQMPEMDGFEATRRIRQLEAQGSSHICIVALTANAMKEDQEQCIQAGMDDYLSKPIKKELLSQTLQKWLGAENQSR